MLSILLAFFRRLRTRISLVGKSKFLTYGKDIHIGKNSRLWAPNYLNIGNDVYIGKNVSIECNCSIGNYCLIANQVAFIGRHDHDYKAIGIPVRYSPWIGDSNISNKEQLKNDITVNDDVWVGYGVIVLSGVDIGKGSIIAAGSIVTRDIPEYSIVAGIPAKVIGKRFSDENIKKHEASITKGKFIFSERGYDHWIIQPYQENNNK